MFPSVAVEAAGASVAPSASELSPGTTAEAAGVPVRAAYAKRRRLGPWRRPGTREAHRDRDLAAMARAGFPYGLGRRVIEADPDAEPLDHEA
mgnify:CR=1 FL=1